MEGGAVEPRLASRPYVFGDADNLALETTGCDTLAYRRARSVYVYVLAEEEVKRRLSGVVASVVAGSR